MAKIFTRRVIAAAAILFVVFLATTDWSNYPGGLMIIAIQEDLGAAILIAIALRWVQLGGLRIKRWMENDSGEGDGSGR